MIFSRQLLVSAALLILSACATQNYSPTGRLILDEVKPDQGVVVVKVENVRPISLLNKKWVFFNVKNKETGEIETIANTAPFVANYSLFAGTLPPGNYEIANFDAPGIGPTNFGLLPALIMDAMTSDSQDLASQPATFTVKPGTVTNLGVIVTSQPDNSDEKFEIAILADEKARAAASGDVEASLKQRIAAFPVQSWDHMPAPGSLEKAAEIIRRKTRLTSVLGATKDGKLLLGGPLGTTFMRTGEGKWDFIQADTTDWVTSVNSLDEGRFWAGTDNGKLFVCSVEQKRCQKSSINTPDAVIVKVVPMNEWGYAIISMNSKKFGLETHVAVMKDLTGTDPAREVYKFDVGTNNLPVLFDGKMLRIYEMVPGISRTSNVYQYNPATGEVSQSEVDFWASNIYRLADGTYVMNRMNGLSSYNDISQDNGHSWVRNDVSTPIASRMRDAKVGFGLSTIGTGWSSVTVTLMKTDDGGQTWTPVGNTIDISGVGPIAYSAGRLFVPSGKALFSTADEGATWAVEWPVPH